MPAALAASTAAHARAQVEHDSHRRVAFHRLHVHAELPQPRSQRAPSPAQLDQAACAPGIGRCAVR